MLLLWQTTVSVDTAQGQYIINFAPGSSDYDAGPSVTGTVESSINSVGQIILFQVTITNILILNIDTPWQSAVRK